MTNNNKVTLDKFKDDKNIKSLTFDTFQEASDFIWNELKEMKKFNFSYATEKRRGKTITHFKLKEKRINYVIQNRRMLFRKNMMKIGDELMINAVS